ncbi:MAG: hypothetical protein IPL61_31340 [Myxococcales bacterium]|nr:hypothetical protein [Myxococcales bacterium]
MSTERPHARARVAALALALALAACETADDRPASWAYVHTAVLEPACATAGCHSRATARAAVDLSTSASAYAVLVGRVCGAPVLPGDPIGNFVRPGHPESSRLMYLLRGERTTIMPPDVPLPDGEIAVIERWILEGATCD